MLIHPAVDLLDGACVRLRRGDYDSVTEFSDDPVEIARRFVDAGAPAMHVVDLDGAREGRPVNRSVALSIADAVDVPIQLGGGLRTDENVAGYLGAGIHRVVLGTRAARDPGWVSRLLDRWGPDRIAAGVDVAGDEIRVEGWLRGAMRVGELLDRLERIGVEVVVYTDTQRDGTLEGPDLSGAERVIDRGFRTLVAGGVSTTGEIARLRRIGAEGAVIGSALYRGRIRLAEALDAASGRRRGGRAG